MNLSFKREIVKVNFQVNIEGIKFVIISKNIDYCRTYINFILSLHSTQSVLLELKNCANKLVVNQQLVKVSFKTLVFRLLFTDPEGVANK